LFISVSAFILPLLLIPIISVIGWSEVIEEIAKFIVIVLLILKLPDRRTQLWAGVAFGAIFGISETCLYFNQIFQFGDFNVFWWRLFLTVPMHILTVLVVIISSFPGKRFTIAGLAVAIALHLLFNTLAIAF